ncbi:hypothetical protein T02_13002, partial [Trichinella nativa]
LIIVESMIYYYAVLLGFIFVKAFSENTTAEFATNSSILLSLTEAENISEQVEAFSSNHSSDADDVAVEMAKHCPEVRCYGRNCAIVREFNACPVCACPIGSPARGCDRMPKYMYDELFKNGCQNLANPTAPRYPAVTVFRWYRYMEQMNAEFTYILIVVIMSSTYGHHRKLEKNAMIIVTRQACHSTQSCRPAVLKLERIAYPIPRAMLA